MLLKQIVAMRLLLVLGLLPASALSNEAGDDGWPSWATSEFDLQQRIARVNEGELAFLADPLGTPVHHHKNRIRVTASSLHDGWVKLEQCHHHLDRVSAAQIVFHPERSRALEVTHYENMDTAVARGNTVQLRGVGDESMVCLYGETRALVEIEDGVYELQNGPYMRRFLDGYYPMRVSLRIEYPDRLTLADFTPADQPGFSVSTVPGVVDAEAVFEGQLRTRFRFLAD
jgi:hypothetical protein